MGREFGTTRLGGWASAIVGICVLGLGSAAAQSQARSVEALIEMLDSSSLAQREAAMASLAGDNWLTLDEAIVLMRAPGLSPEQRHRLEQVGQDLFFNSPRAAMGIQFGEIGPEGVAIGMTLPNFHAQEVLLRGDVIMVADGEPMMNQDDLRRVILSNDPGYELPLVLKRDGKEMEVSVELGRLHDLGRQPAMPSLFALAWQRRLEKLGVDQTDNLGEHFDFRAWAGEAQHVPPPVNGDDEEGDPDLNVDQSSEVDLRVGGAESMGASTWMGGVLGTMHAADFDGLDLDGTREKLLRLLIEEQANLNALEDRARKNAEHLARMKVQDDQARRFEVLEAHMQQQIADSRMKINRYLRSIKAFERNPAVPGGQRRDR